MARVFVGMSGGVDSSVAAALLMEQGHDVVGITLDLISTNATVDAAQVCEQLGIPHRVVSFREEFNTLVVKPFISAYESGYTPNPCVDCNQNIKFGLLLDYALREGADYLATGHYARIIDEGLHRARNLAKDQSYFLYRIIPRLEHIMFPLGDFETKEEIRDLALQYGLHVAEKKDSQEVCFVSTHYIDLLSPDLPQLQPGRVLTMDGIDVGEHTGVLRYTIGQRRGIHYTRQLPEKMLVSDRDISKNIVYVSPIDELKVDRIYLNNCVLAEDSLVNLTAVNRYHAEPISVSLSAMNPDGKCIVCYDENVAPVASGQSVVLYKDNRVVGGGYAT